MTRYPFITSLVRMVCCAVCAAGGVSSLLDLRLIGFVYLAGAVLFFPRKVS